MYIKRNLSTQHPKDSALLAYLDAELPRAGMRWTEQHLQSCWQCRSALSKVELRAQLISKILLYQDEADIARTRAAKDKFLQLKTLLEARWKALPRARLFFFMPRSSEVIAYEHVSHLLSI